MVDSKDFCLQRSKFRRRLELFSIPVNVTQIVCGEVSWRIRRETPLPLHDISSPNVENFQLEPHLSNTSHRFSGISFPFLESFRQILGGATSSAVGGGFSRSTILSFLPSSFLPTTRRRSNSRGNGQLSYFLFFFFYLLLAKGNVGKGLRSQHLLYSFRIFRFAGAPLYWETFIPFHLQISRANFPRSLRYLSKVDKYIILWIIILIRNRFRKSS